MAELVDLVVDVRVFRDVGIASRDVRLGLVVVVIADEVLDGVVGEELLELGAKLGRERLVVREDERWPAGLLDDVGNAERLAGAGDAQQRLVAVAPVHALYELLDSLRLVAGWDVVRDKIELRGRGGRGVDTGHGLSLADGRDGLGEDC